VFNFKQPNSEEIDHDYLWRTNKALPERGRIGVFNRSYYEEVLVVKVHNLVKTSSIPEEYITKDIWDRRYSHIKNMEKYLIENGIIPVKIFLNVSKEEQKNRFLERIENPEKNWKFASGDVTERKYWDDYQNAYEEAINQTATKDVPWYVIPADEKWYARYQVSEIVLNVLENLKLEYPVLSDEEKAKLEECKNMLLSEDGKIAPVTANIATPKEIDSKKKKKKNKKKDKK
jgi:PPK2 family polyphosphate:nucleotide phosphotransferase